MPAIEGLPKLDQLRLIEECGEYNMLLFYSQIPIDCFKKWLNFS